MAKLELDFKAKAKVFQAIKEPQTENHMREIRRISFICDNLTRICKDLDKIRRHYNG